MWIIVAGICTASLACLVVEAPALRRTQQKKDLIVFYLMLLAGTALSIIEFATNFKLPNPSRLIIIVYKPVYEVVKTLLEQ
ncbi:hypothetical protein ACFPES_20760 [Paenibacillus sp. GCM10023248]|uniref:hypothetical protein n=1 Tax=Bacillales TaxID=1385 RepID=UPI002377FB3B|nr:MULTISPECIES: hypothetical protein [Bacillales]MDD9269487.1 hypothetical protein [Paenibacillus sp. MAHUQ-63]MDR6880895.1 hypothetical protein [Bacillus sp. 3255]